MEMINTLSSKYVAKNFSITLLFFHALSYLEVTNLDGFLTYLHLNNSTAHMPYLIDYASRMIVYEYGIVNFSPVIPDIGSCKVF
jgi:hypothetical protein